MAADEALLESLAAGVASLRFYTWSTATVSLGYFQPAELRRTDPLIADLPWVRRSSGGGALIHHHEVTYALALPAGPPWHSAESWTCRFHHAVHHALKSFGVTTQGCVCGEEKNLSELLCFLHHTPGDLLIAGHKVVGSAQRRQRGAIMQHGGILLARSEYTPSLPGVSELAGIKLTPVQVAGAVAAAFAESTGFRLSHAGWTDAELCRTDELIGAKYAHPAWSYKR
jgi:lipoate-protein ligase A